MSDPYHEHEDRLLIEEHAAHPERFQKVEPRPAPETKTERQQRAGKIMHLAGRVALLERQRDAAIAILRDAIECAKAAGFNSLSEALTAIKR